MVRVEKRNRQRREFTRHKRELTLTRRLPTTTATTYNTWRQNTTKESGVKREWVVVFMPDRITVRYANKDSGWSLGPQFLPKNWCAVRTKSDKVRSN